ncbi:unnamed protein product [Darwinula stevensoni]|uniref:Uncharacterized protein n=1 Tax=Darwinula stevensoni TaxID=69355 RepID=A0A7R9FQ37_9CRUS|nr:unnamed protein product [Darwinula stevensoni]CAG0899023.1 unnamed protein product [Darwinula stevensoni]
MDPSSAIPKGTLTAVILTYFSYVGYAVMMGGVAVREASGVESELNMDDILSSPAFDCSNRTCEWGLQNNNQMMTAASAWFPLIYAGCFAATLSSAIASLVGAPRVFQVSLLPDPFSSPSLRHGPIFGGEISSLPALAKDKLYPGIGFFAVGYGANNDPVRGYVASFIIGVACILIANLNAVATLVVNFFLAAYALINFSVFHATVTKAPGWRPSFKYYNAWLSLLGTLISVVVMFMIQWEVALATFGVTMALYLLVHYRKPDANWGSSTQAQVYSTALKNAHELNRTPEHVKNYRPQLLVLAGSPNSRPPLLDFAYLLTKSNSLLIIGNVVKEPMKHSARSILIHKGYAWLRRHGIKSFYDIIENERLDHGAKSFLQLSGLGKLRPNILLLGFKANWVSCPPSDTLQYFNVIHDAFDTHLAVGILRVQEGLDFSEIVEEESPSVEKEKPETNRSEVSLGEMGVESTPEVSPGNHTTNATEMHKKKKEKRKQPSQMYRGPGGAALPKTVVDNLTRFQQKQKEGRIDVWWLYDDGGLTILLPYLFMAALLSKFRIDYSDVIVVTDAEKMPAPEVRQEFDALIEPFKEKPKETREPGTYIPAEELTAKRDKNNHHMRLRELLLHHSIDASLIVMTLPMPRKGAISAPLYMAWLDILTKGMPPFLMIRGNQTSVITFYC